MPNQNFELNPDIHPTSNTPPTSLLQAENDQIHVENVVTYFLALKKVKVSAELHVYAEGGHGYGLRRTDFPITNWPKTFEVWLGSIKILPAESGN
jgi:acetyl esterase/lipase